MSLPLPTIIAKTFTPLYSEHEDRIRLVINYADYENRFDLWLTRAFLLKLLPMIEDYIDKYGTDAHVKELQIKTDSQTQKQTDSSTLTITEKKGYLVSSVDIAYDQENQQFQLLFKTEMANIMSVLNDTLLKTVLKSIFQAIPHISWGISHTMVR